LIFFSIIAAFCGTQKAQLIFNSIPFIIFWYFFILLFLIGFIVYPSLSHKADLLMVHAGCIILLTGAMWSSQIGHKVSNRFFNKNKIPKGYMILSEGEFRDFVLTDTLYEVSKLPFIIKLKDFRIDHYKDGEIKNFISDVQIMNTQNDVQDKTITVNHPIHYGGYHIYQFSYDPQGKFSVLLITSDSGLYIVFTGYLLICIGITIKFLLKPVKDYLKIKWLLNT
jgi:hypothetical protein